MTAANRLAQRLRRHWALLAACAGFLLAGALALDGYGVAVDEPIQRQIGMATLDYLSGDGERAYARLFSPSDRYYGALVEAPLALIERIAGLDDSRDVYLGRHLLTHLFFLAGGVFCYLLAWRLFGSRALALLAMVLFLLHPRIYAHSFFNSKDMPFLVAFVIALSLIHRAFRRDTLAAFLLCGVGVGLLVNLRVMGLLLLAAVLVMRALDLALAKRTEERKRVLLTAGGFALAAALMLHAVSPVLWGDPIGRFAETFRVFGSHPWIEFNLFRGEWLYSPNGPPLAYVPVWVGITTPPATLLLALAGTVALAWRGLRRPRAIIRDGPTRFGFVLLALPVTAVLVVVGLESNIYTGWRQLYFLHAPLLLLALFGLQGLASLLRGRGRWPRMGAYALAGAAAAVAVVSTIRIHPHQDDYFNLLADRTTPEGVSARYEVNYWNQSFRAVLDELLGDHPSGTLHAATRHARNRWLLHPDDRERFSVTRDFRSGERNFLELRDGQPCPDSAAYVSRVYADTLHCIVDPVAYFGGLRRAALAAEPLHRSRFDAYRVGDVMVYVRDECSASDARTRFFLRVYPVDPAGLPPYHPEFRYRGGYGFEHRDFDFARFGARIDGDCVAAVPLSGRPIASIRTGQFTPEYAEAARDAVAGGEPLVRAWFDIHPVPDERALTYVRDGCSAEDAAARFFLHVYPVDGRALPDWRAEHGFGNLDFDFREYGVRLEDGACVITAPLPAYPIATIQTGQYDGTGERWAVEFDWPAAE